MDSPVDQNQNISQGSSTTGPVPTPGSLGYRPVQSPGPETPGEKADTVETQIQETTPPVESIKPEATAEKLKTYEKIGTLTQQVQDEQDQKTTDGTQADMRDLEEHIVDKTDEPVELHEIQQTKDKLTGIADEKEKEFIQEVQSAHGRGK